VTEWTGGTAEPGLRTRTVTRAGVDLHVVEAGEGSPVVLAHGFPDLGYTWRRQLPALAAAGYRVMAPDQRGYGRSGRPDRVEAYDIEQLTDDLICLVDDLGEERAVFVGHN
jgi:pimeloyl-ACP methyl ester carboxylesterase